MYSAMTQILYFIFSAKQKLGWSPDVRGVFGVVSGMLSLYFAKIFFFSRTVCLPFIVHLKRALDCCFIFEPLPDQIKHCDCPVESLGTGDKIATREAHF